MSLKHAILVLLDKEPRSGYDLLKEFKNSLGYFWNASHQQIYQQLKRLSDEGLIDCDIQQQDGKPDKKNYSITPYGHQHLQEWVNQEVKPNKVNDALLVKLFAGHLCPTEHLETELKRHQDIHRNTLDKLLKIEKRYQQLSSTQQEHYKLPYLTLRRGILGEQAWLAWVDEAIKAIKK